jgi:pyruvate dehydrogenase E2 component (dihydrolipoamide acetyltransferase)
MDKKQIVVPDIGGAENVDVIEILVKPGDVVAVEDSIVTLEGDKASMEVPTPVAGQVHSIDIKVGDKVSEGSLLLTLVAETAVADEASVDTTTTVEATAAKATTSSQAMVIPDMGDANAVDVIEVLVSVGDQVEIDTPLITLEGDKASMEVPAEFAGVVESITLKIGDKVSAGDVIGMMAVTGQASAPSAPVSSATASQPISETAVQETVPSPKTQPSGKVHAGPAVRRLARELDLDLHKVPATGAKGRITKDDLKRFMQGGKGGSTGAFTFAARPAIDFSKFGATSTESLSKIQKLSGANLHQNWVGIPHVTQFDEADITELEAFRQEHKAKAKADGVRLTPIAFIMKAAVVALKAFPRFNSSLSADGSELILKHYYNIGVAVDTPNGLVVPVIRDVDQKGLYDIARELGAISEKARTKGLGMKDMQGGCFTISSLGGIGGTAFTPIINAPEVAILGVSKSQTKPIYDAYKQIQPRLMLPLSLSYDHRVIDGAEGARFVVYLSRCLADIRTLLL